MHSIVEKIREKKPFFFFYGSLSLWFFQTWLKLRNRNMALFFNWSSWRTKIKIEKFVLKWSKMSSLMFKLSENNKDIPKNIYFFCFSCPWRLGRAVFLSVGRTQTFKDIYTIKTQAKKKTMRNYFLTICKVKQVIGFMYLCKCKFFFQELLKNRFVRPTDF